MFICVDNKTQTRMLKTWCFFLNLGPDLEKIMLPQIFFIKKKKFNTVGDWEAEGNCLRAALQRCRQCQRSDSCIASVMFHCSK